MPVLIKEDAARQLRELFAPAPTTVRKAESTETPARKAIATYSTNPNERLIELEAEQAMEATMEVKDIPTRVLEMELKRRREAAQNADVSEADLAQLHATTFGHEADKGTEAGDEADLDALGAAVFGRGAA